MLADAITDEQLGRFRGHCPKPRYYQCRIFYPAQVEGMADPREEMPSHRDDDPHYSELTGVEVREAHDSDGTDLEPVGEFVARFAAIKWKAPEEAA